MKDFITIEKVLNKKPDEVAKLCGSSLSTYYRYRKGVSAPSVKCLEQLLKSVPELNPEWLFLDGVPVFRKTISNRSTTQKFTVQYEDGSTDAFLSIPFYEFSNNTSPEEEAFIRDNAWDNSGSSILITDNFLKKTGIKSQESVIIAEAGCQSMAPYIPKGSMCLVDTEHNYFTTEGIYLVKIHRAIKFRMIQQLPGGHLRLSTMKAPDSGIGINPDEPGFEILGRVIWVGKHI